MFIPPYDCGMEILHDRQKSNTSMKILSIMKISIFFMIDKTTTIMSRYLGSQIQISPCLGLCVCPHWLSHYPTKRKIRKSLVVWP